MVDGSLWRQHDDEFEFVAFTTLVIIWIVCRRDLHSSRSEFHVDKCRITDNWDASAIEGMYDMLAMQVFVARIFRVDSNASIAQHRLQTCRRDNQLLIRILNRIRKRRQHPKLIPSPIIVRVALVRLHLQKRPSLELQIIHLDVRYGRF